jgi:hypothetical protein
VREFIAAFAIGLFMALPLRAAEAPPYPPSPVIRNMTWAPVDSVVRAADDCDNWPLTWADDGHLYGAYGDGRGFAPKVEKKLSLGLARIEGPPDHFVGVNVRAPTLERTGNGKAGPKASGLLCVDGTLYLLARNTGNAQLAWSKDHGRTWTWSDWKFTTSFGCPTFLNFGRDYAGARDGFVYVYSPDADGAYEAADRMVLARVPKDRIPDPGSYEFFVGRGDKGDRGDKGGKGDRGEPVWSRDVRDRGAVFEHKGGCYRSGIVYNAALKRYVWWQVIPGGDTRYAGGFGVYDAPEPWGPWTCAYFTERWDTGPGESATFPSKWISDDGRTMYLVFSGDDSLSVRRVTLVGK